MKFILTLLCASFLVCVAHAQSGQWLWGRGSSGSGVDAYAVAADGLGSVYVGGINLNDSAAIFGGITIPCNIATNIGQVIWAKYSPDGTALWADGTQNGDAWLYNIITDPSGNLIVFGSFDSPTLTIDTITLTNAAYGTSVYNQYFIAKYNPSGTLLWAICDGSSLPTEQLLSYLNILSSGGITTDVSGNIYITSSFQGRSATIGSYTLQNADTSGNTDDIFVAKYDSSGKLVWATSIGGISADFAYGITVIPEGNIYITGLFCSPAITIGTSVIVDSYYTGGAGYFPIGTPLAFIAEFSSAGVPIWAQAAGDTFGAFGLGLASDQSGNVYMTGGFGGASISFGSTTINRTYPAASPNAALYLVQFSPEHIVTWSKTIGSATKGVWGYSIALAGCGQVWVSGNYTQDASIDGQTLPLAPGADPIFIAGYNLNGGVIGFSGLGSGGDDQNAITCDPNGNIFVCADYWNDSVFSIGPDTLSTITGYPTNEYFYIGKYANFVGVQDTNFAHKDTDICTTSNVSLSAPIGYKGYYWDNGSVLSTRSVTLPGTYWVMCTGVCGGPILIDTINVLDNCLLWIPSAFTPNNDGRDDIFGVVGDLSQVQNFSFSIYNRWGQRIFFTEDVYHGWDGKFNGIPQDIGTYFYMIHYDLNGRSHTMKGDLTLIR